MKIDYHIKVPQWGAGTTHKWDQERFGIRGVGIATFRLKKRMVLGVGDSTYKTSKDDILAFMEEYPDSKDTKNGVTLFVVPLEIMTYVTSEKVKKLLAFKAPESSQLSLF